MAALACCVTNSTSKQQEPGERCEPGDYSPYQCRAIGTYQSRGTCADGIERINCGTRCIDVIIDTRQAKELIQDCANHLALYREHHVLLVVHVVPHGAPS